MYTKHSMLVEKDSPIEITMSKVTNSNMLSDDILMNIRESIFNQLSEKEVCIISIATDFEFAHFQKKKLE